MKKFVIAIALVIASCSIVSASDIKPVAKAKTVQTQTSSVKKAKAKVAVKKKVAKKVVAPVVAK